MAIKYLVKAATSEYTDKEGNQKKRYTTIGAVFESKHGLMMSLESIPLFGLKEGKLLCYLNEPEDKAIATTQVSKSFVDDSTPF
jgi:hypothetical protein